MWVDAKGNCTSLLEIVGIIEHDHEIFVGTDSQLVADRWIFATVICLYREGRGGRLFFRRTRKKKSDHQSLEDRLLAEVYNSVAVADEIRNMRPSLRINVHADISSKEKNKSNRVAKLAESYINGMGFNAKIKPEAWAAAAVADRFTR